MKTIYLPLLLLTLTKVMALPCQRSFYSLDSTKLNDQDSLATKKVMLISTNFNVPMVQYVPLITSTTKKGDVSFFNAVGAGIGFSIADIESARDKDGKVINTDVKNIIGVQSGFLFSSNAAKEGSNNQFAWTMSLVILDFQIGYGHQFGSIIDNQQRNFMNFSYSIPLSKLSKAGSFILRYKNKGNNNSFKTVQKSYFLK